MQGSVAVLVDLVDIYLLAQALQESLLPLVNGRQMQYVLALGVRHSQVEPEALQHLRTLALVLEVGVGQSIALQRVVIVEKEVVLERCFL